jgi:hypothetical protein
MPTLSIIVPALERLDSLRLQLAQLAACKGTEPYEGVVVGPRIQPRLVDPRLFRDRARCSGREMAELDLSLAARASPGLAARIRVRMRPLRALVELCGWSLAWLWAGSRSERTRLPERARAPWGLESCKVRLRGAAR